MRRSPRDPYGMYSFPGDDAGDEPEPTPTPQRRRDRKKANAWAKRRRARRKRAKRCIDEPDRGPRHGKPVGVRCVSCKRRHGEKAD